MNHAQSEEVTERAKYAARKRNTYYQPPQKGPIYLPMKQMQDLKLKKNTDKIELVAIPCLVFRFHNAAGSSLVKGIQIWRKAFDRSDSFMTK